jgi:integrase
VRSGAARMPTATWYLPERTALYEPTSIMKALKRLAIEAGLRSVPQHDLRHVAARSCPAAAGQEM